MPTLDKLRKARAAAGAAYAAAASAYVAAAVELSAYDGACSNASIGGEPTPRFNRPPEVLAHPDFLPPAAAAALTSPNITGPVVQARLDALLVSAKGGLGRSIILG
ncbi:hypothetical protein QO010_000380 [Caulobacter ginsengisoli]|uniref:Uncharacterized protein n=1 Tax=Caulobacter ginsengisoli TaxID=400775 RepID=A0ABU0INT8_9CAUL|nr:hypothetical protein [Caulobacter ginsengisoli]MDQ0462632.1 hypothetical protein [Caulobacter ginsengisoli]